MGNPLVTDADREKLADVLQEQAGYLWWDEIHNDRERALYAVDEIIKAGWVPIKREEPITITYNTPSQTWMNDPKMGPPNPPNPTWNRPYG